MKMRASNVEARGGGVRVCTESQGRPGREDSLRTEVYQMNRILPGTAVRRGNATEGTACAKGWKSEKA